MKTSAFKQQNGLIKKKKIELIAGMWLGASSKSKTVFEKKNKKSSKAKGIFTVSMR